MRNPAIRFGTRQSTARSSRLGAAGRLGLVEHGQDEQRDPGRPGVGRMRASSAGPRVALPPSADDEGRDGSSGVPSARIARTLLERLGIGEGRPRVNTVLGRRGVEVGKRGGRARRMRPRAAGRARPWRHPGKVLGGDGDDMPGTARRRVGPRPRQARDREGRLRRRPASSRRHFAGPSGRRQSRRRAGVRAVGQRRPNCVDPSSDRDAVGALDLEALGDQLARSVEWELEHGRMSAEQPRSGEGHEGPEHRPLEARRTSAARTTPRPPAGHRLQHPRRLGDRPPDVRDRVVGPGPDQMVVEQRLQHHVVGRRPARPGRVRLPCAPSRWAGSGRRAADRGRGRRRRSPRPGSVSYSKTPPLPTSRRRSRAGTSG